MNTDLENLLKYHIVSVILKSGAVIHCTQLAEYMPIGHSGKLLLQESNDDSNLLVFDMTHKKVRYIDKKDVDKYLI